MNNILLDKIGIVFIVISSLFFVMLFQSNYADTALPSPNDNRIQYFGCTDYITTFHCDLLPNRMTAYAYAGHSIRILDLANFNPNFVQGKYDKALELSAPYREAIHVPSISDINFKDFTVSFWTKPVPQAEASWSNRVVYK